MMRAVCWAERTVALKVACWAVLTAVCWVVLTVVLSVVASVVYLADL